ncbi:MAG TPA: T9SS type A sorting domain-containing protein [Mucilaginibacter sp.]|jgi:hypothetical protein|nr:T9SS type A sorting domain-containing protein [Mucilaginibacter sp.]
MATKKYIRSFTLGLMLMPSLLFGQGIIISSNAYVIANSGYVVVTGNMANSGTLNLQTGSFTMSGNYTNSGTYTQGTANMVFNGSNQVLIDNSSGTLFTNVFFSGNGGSGNPAVMSSGNFSVSSQGVLQMVNATCLNANGNLTLNSDATGSATVAAIPSGSTITNSVKVERYFTGGTHYRGYRLISSPVYSATVSSNNVFSINYLTSSVFLTGASGGGFDKASNPTLYLYREDQTPSNSSFTSGNFEGISAINNSPAYNYSVSGAGTSGTFNLPAGNGVMFFFRGNKASASLTTETTPGYTPVTVTTTTPGTLNQGQVTVHDWYTPSSANLGYTGSGTGTNYAVRGFNLVGNPYASSIDWEQYNTTTTTSGIYANNVGITAYELNPLTNNYDVYQVGGIHTNNGSRVIASGQGFFVLATNASSPQLIFNESAKTTSQNTGLNLFMATKNDLVALNTAHVDSHLRLQMAMDSINTDDIYIGFKSNASAQFINDEDAPYKKGTGKVHLASFSSDSVMLAINKMPLAGPKQTAIPLFVTATAYGTYKLNMTELEAIPQLYQVWLMDRFNKDSLDIRHNPTYAFDITTDTNSYGKSRFQLILRQDPALMVHLLSFGASKVSRGAQEVWVTENEQNYTGFTVERSNDGGATFAVLGFSTSTASGTYDFLDQNPVQGADLYRLKLTDLNGNVTYSNTVTLMYGNINNSLVKTGITVYPNPAKSTLNLSIANGFSTDLSLMAIDTQVQAAASYDVQVSNILGAAVKKTTINQQSWQTDVSELTPGTYIISVVNNKDKSLVGQAKFIKL